MAWLARAAHRAPTPLQLREVVDRRADPRLSADVLGLDPAARLTAGVQVQVVNLSARGALLEQREWLRPGTRTELRLARTGPGDEPEQYAASAVVARCWVHALSPLRYRTALVFAGDLAVPARADEAFDEVEVELVLQELTA